MPFKRGAPRGNQNRLKHGRFSAASIRQRKLVRETIRSAQRTLLAARLELYEARGALMDKST